MPEAYPEGVKPHITFQTAATMSARLPLYALGMGVIATHSEAESYLSLMMVSLLGTKPAPGAAIFALLKANHFQTKALTTVASMVLREEGVFKLRSALKILDESAEGRNALAHCMWGLDENIPDGVVLAKSNLAASFSVEVLHAAGQQDVNDRISSAARSMNEDLQIWRECHFTDALVKAKRAHSSMQNAYFEVTQEAFRRHHLREF